MRTHQVVSPPYKSVPFLLCITDVFKNRFKGSIRIDRLVANFLFDQVRTLNNKTYCIFSFIKENILILINKVRKTYLQRKHSCGKKNQPLWAIYSLNAPCCSFFHCAQGHNNSLGTYHWKNSPLDQKFTFSDDSVGLLLGVECTVINHMGTKETEERYLVIACLPHQKHSPAPEASGALTKSCSARWWRPADRAPSLLAQCQHG